MSIRSAEIRAKFVEFWAAKDHRIVKSAPLVPKEDPTLLFTSAGMVQFKKYYASREPLEFRRAVSVQKCLRATDIESVGHTPRHCTFFEMLGHFSFGDYFKREAILWNWEFFTKVLPLPEEKLRPSVFEEDPEALAIWRDEVGFPDEKIARLGRKDNFWGPAGDTGACGPSSELYFDLGAELGCGRPGCGPGCDCDRWIEVGNFVFPQFDRQKDGSDLPLANRGIDTGIGLERLTMVIQGKKTIFESDLFAPIVEAIRSSGAAPYEGEHKPSYHVIADHARAITFALTEGILPSNEGRGYLIRRLLRRAAVQGHRLGLREPFLHRLADTVVATMGNSYPELVEAAPAVRSALRQEEERFESTLEQGLARFEEIAGRHGSGKRLGGAELFLLYDTYGFPPDLTQVLAQERGLDVDLDGFEREMEKQRERSRASATFYKKKGEKLDWTVVSDGPHSSFIGYDFIEAETTLRRFAPIPEAAGEFWLVVETTPFYAESGGQVGDVGTITGNGFAGRIVDALRVDKEIRHRLRLESGAIQAGDVHLLVNREARNATRRNHTATHLLQAALRARLGKHVTQAGSLVAPDRLRFDFTHGAALSEEDIEAVETEVNAQILADSEVGVRFSSYEAAIRDGVMALFGEKYEETVRRIVVPGYSEELCGGTHVSRTGEIGAFVILSEGGIAAGVRRIEAITGTGAIAVWQRERRIVHILRGRLQGTLEDLPARVERLMEEAQKLRKEIRELRKGGHGEERADLFSGVLDLPKGRLLVAETEMESKDGIRDLGDAIRARLGRGVALVAVRISGKATLLAAVTDDLVAAGTVKADAIVREGASLAGGSGGGRPHLAMAGIPDGADLSGLLATMRGRLEQALS